MQLRTKWGVLALAILLLSSVGTTGLVLAQSNSSTPVAQTSASLPAALQKEPLNPAFVQYQQNKSAGKVATQTVNGLGLGWVPPPYELSKAPTATSLAQVQAQATYPATYDLRTMNKVSPVEDQGSCGSCWTFATFGSLESYLLPGLTTTYSENNLKNFADFDYTCCAGGDSAMSTAYLARWGTTMTDATGATIHGGPVTSASDPYSDSSCTSSATTSQIAMHVQNVYYLPLKQSALDNNAIKSALMTYGGVYTAFQWESSSSSTTTSYWNQATAAYYDYNAPGANHAVTIVGWDDNFSAKNFSTTPPGNGAWICKNSWGTSFGQSGYFYVSYYDLNMGYQENTVFTAEPTTNYTTNYQYDPSGMEGGVGSGSSSTAYGANVFTANSTGTLNAVSFWAPVEDTQYTAQVYVTPTNSSNPTSGTLMSTISGTASNAGYAYAGYYTESLSTTVPLTKGEKFAVVVKFTTPGDNDPVPVQYKESGYDDNAPNAIPGQSFYSLDGTSWNDLATAYGAGNAYVANIHAFASSSPSPSLALTASASPTTVSMKQNFTINGTLSTGTTSIAGAAVTLQRSTNNAAWTNATTNVTDVNGNYQFSYNESAAGTYYYRAAYSGNATYGSVTSNTVSVNVIKTATALTLTASNTTPAVNQSVTFTATLRSGGTPIPKLITVYYYLNGVRYNYATAYTTLTFATKWTTPGVRTYYATFAGDSSYNASASSGVPISVGATQLTLTASNTTPAVNQSVTFTATLRSGGTPIPKLITVYYYLNGVRYNYATAYTTLTFATKWTTPGVRTYYATFAGDSSHQPSTSSGLTITVS